MIERLSVTLSCVSFAALCSVWAPVAHAADIYRWVDEKGQTHIADTVPPQYKKNATRIDTRASQVSESERAQAAERAAREKAALDSSRAAPASAPGAVELTPKDRPGASGLDEKRAQCEEWRRAYAESQACFSRYGTVSGAVRAEAYQRCTEVADPSPSCGIPSN
jgi:hypothetical protein